MEVTDENFNEVLPEIKEGIENCTFASIDCEFTGLHTSRNLNAFDTPKEYYGKCRRNCKEFLVIQYGLSLFRYDPESESFKQRSYNFYIFRKPNRNVPDLRFLSQSSSIDFLANQGFDFNKLFKHGISYLNQEEGSKYRCNIHNRIAESSETERRFQVVIPDHAKQYVDDAMKKVAEFINSDLTELELPRCNSFFRRLMYQLQQESNNTFSLETRLVNNDRILIVKRPKTKEERDEIQNQRLQEQLEVYENAIGFSKVVQMLSKSRKLVVGHNLCFDLLHTIDKFLIPLPDAYEEFKEVTNKHLFPKILDTKYMSSLHPFDALITSNILKPLLATVCQDPFSPPKVEIEDGFKGYEKGDAKDHEAGYDAYITGLAFLCMWRYLGTSSNINSKEIFDRWDLLDPYINRIGLTALMEKQHINLDGEDLILRKDHVLYMTFPNSWKSENILQLFSPYSNINIYWINETSAYVSLYKKDQAAIALKALANGSNYTVMSYHNRQAMYSGIKMPLQSPTTRKRKSGDDFTFAKRVAKRSSKMSIGSIDEQMESEENGNSGTTATQKVFEEDSSWE